MMLTANTQQFIVEYLGTSLLLKSRLDLEPLPPIDSPNSPNRLIKSEMAVYPQMKLIDLHNGNEFGSENTQCTSPDF